MDQTRKISLLGRRFATEQEARTVAAGVGAAWGVWFNKRTKQWQLTVAAGWHPPGSLVIPAIQTKGHEHGI